MYSYFFKKYFPHPPKKILEGGCGVGKYVIAYRRLGYDIVGVDFSSETIKRLKNEVDKDLPVYEADITALPFEDNTFDCYYSGGVIEHFEEGPDKALKEARRVLKKDGILLATVPYVNLIRRICFLFSETGKGEGYFQKKCAFCRHDGHPPAEHKFSDYSFDIKSLIAYFRNNNFVLEKSYPTDLMWGEIGISLQRHMAGCEKNKDIGMQKDNASASGKTKRPSFIRNLVYDFLITENRDNIFLRIPLTALNYLSGHMILFVARAV